MSVEVPQLVLQEAVRRALIREFGVTSFDVWRGKSGLFHHPVDELAAVAVEALGPLLDRPGIASEIAALHEVANSRRRSLRSTQTTGDRQKGPNADRLVKTDLATSFVRSGRLVGVVRGPPPATLRPRDTEWVAACRRLNGRSQSGRT